MRLVISDLDDNSKLVRICQGNGPEYNRMIVVTDRGDELFLSGWIGTPLTHNEWKAAAKQYFPNAKKVVFNRIKNGKQRTVFLNI